METSLNCIQLKRQSPNQLPNEIIIAYEGKMKKKKISNQNRKIGMICVRTNIKGSAAESDLNEKM